MRLIAVMPHPSKRPLIALLLPFLASAAIGQSCWVSNSYRIANSFSGQPSQLSVLTGPQTTAPLSTPGSNSNPSATCTSSGSCWPIADYGALRVSGSGTATNCPTSGVFLFLDQAPQAEFLDTMTVVSPSLPAGTPVQLQFVLTFDGFCTLIDSAPTKSFGATLQAGSLSLAITDTTGTANGTLASWVGATLIMRSRLNVTLYPYGVLSLGIPPQSSSYDVDLSARVGVSCTTPGASLTFCSGRDYQPLIAQVASAGGGCGAGSPTQNATPPQLGQTQVYTAAAATPNQLVLLAWATGPAVALPLGPCVVTENPANVVLLVTGVTDAAGGASFGVGIPNAPSLAGDRFTTQLLVLSPGGPLLGIAQLTNGLTSTIGL